MKPWVLITLIIAGLVTLCLFLSCLSRQHEEGYVEDGEVSLFYKSSGEGVPVIVLHGGPGFGFHYLEPHLSFLTQKFKLIYFDQRGCGRSSEEEPGRITFDRLVDDIEILRNELKLERVNILGHSFGALLALEYAKRYPDRCGSLVLAGAAPMKSAYLPKKNDFSRLSYKEQNRYQEISKNGSFEGGDPEAVSFIFSCLFKMTMAQGEEVSDIDLGLDRERVVKMFNVMTALKPFMDSYDMTPGLESLRSPVLIIHGEKDPVGEESAMALHDLIPNSIFIIYNDTGHFPFAEKKYDFVQDVMRFFTMYAK
ncbi:MAG TPA: alpha/beta hydrolase [Candidatus Mcinerneyibacteriales bacterium]|nr:alpha/beta hydrolase [Candidatus Mcinerneyibacteriales bacterium]HPJ70522.1 alpha/beta hydrolase [Candidatus Mcinerneyibacteriales bacterium]HPQ89033.1 alpha/beta hydrolase [Candidatus Mcinerneyibacteriales bacterium]